LRTTTFDPVADIREIADPAIVLKEFDMVRLTTDLPEIGLGQGAIGTILMVHSSPSLAYEVEFVGLNETVAVGPDRLRPVELGGS
jgi:hypothetical protein